MQLVGKRLSGVIAVVKMLLWRLLRDLFGYCGCGHGQKRGAWCVEEQVKDVGPTVREHRHYDELAHLNEVTAVKTFPYAAEPDEQHQDV